MDKPRLIAKELQLELSSAERTLYFHGESMRPFLVEGDEVVVEPVEWDDIRRGDVVTYRFMDRFPTRRLIRKTDEEMVLWCENWPERIFKAARSDLLGRAVARRRDGRWLRSSDARWKLAELRAMLRWRVRHLRRVTLPRTLRRARRTPSRVLRMIGVLPSIGNK
jgi:hypothetical protein